MLHNKIGDTLGKVDWVSVLRVSKIKRVVQDTSQGTYICTRKRNQGKYRDEMSKKKNLRYVVFDFYRKIVSSKSWTWFMNKEDQVVSLWYYRKLGNDLQS